MTNCSQGGDGSGVLGEGGGDVLRGMLQLVMENEVDAFRIEFSLIMT